MSDVRHFQFHIVITWYEGLKQLSENTHIKYNKEIFNQLLQQLEDTLMEGPVSITTDMYIELWDILRRCQGIILTAMEDNEE